MDTFGLGQLPWQNCSRRQTTFCQFTAQANLPQAERTRQATRFLSKFSMPAFTFHVHYVLFPVDSCTWVSQSKHHMGMSNFQTIKTPVPRQIRKEKKPPNGLLKAKVSMQSKFDRVKIWIPAKTAKLIYLWGTAVSSNDVVVWGSVSELSAAGSFTMPVLSDLTLVLDGAEPCRLACR